MKQSKVPEILLLQQSSSKKVFFPFNSVKLMPKTCKHSFLPQQRKRPAMAIFSSQLVSLFQDVFYFLSALVTS